MKKYSAFIILALIILLASVLRITGLSWGLPTTKYFHAASYYPDESEVLKAYRGFNLRKLNFRLSTDTVNIKGTFQPYLMAAWIKTASVFKLVDASSSFDSYKNAPNKLVNLYLTGKSMSVFFGLLTIPLLFIITNKFYGDYKIALLASFLLAISPVHVIWSHYITTDVVLTFEVCLIFLLCLSLIKNESQKIYLMSGLLVGLTGATKYSIAPIALLPVIAHVLSGNKIFDKRLLIYFLFIPVGFIIGNPYSIIDPKHFIAALKLSREINLYFDPSKNPFDCFGPQSNLLFYLTSAPRYGFGIPLSLFFLCGVIYAFIKKEKIDILILSWIVIYYLFISLTSPWKILRWQLPYVPLLCILSARFIIAIIKNAKTSIRFLIILAVFIVSITTLFYSASYIKIMKEKDIRDVASEWIEGNIPEGKKIAVPDVYFWNPSIVMTLYWYKGNEPFLAGIKKYKIYQTDYDRAELNKINPDYVILSDFEYYPFLRMKDKYPHPEMLPLLEEVMAGGKYKLIKTFEKRPELFGITSAAGFLPHELRMISPSILVYKHVL